MILHVIYADASPPLKISEGDYIQKKIVLFMFINVKFSSLSLGPKFHQYLLQFSERPLATQNQFIGGTITPLLWHTP